MTHHNDVVETLMSRQAVKAELERIEQEEGELLDASLKARQKARQKAGLEVGLEAGLPQVDFIVAYNKIIEKEGLSLEQWRDF